MTVLPGGGASGGGGGQASVIYAKIGGGSYSVPTPIDGKSLRATSATLPSRQTIKKPKQNWSNKIFTSRILEFEFPAPGDYDQMDRCTQPRG